MLRNLKVATISASVSLLVPAGLSAQMSFKKVEARTAYRGAEQGNKGTLIVSADSIRFLKKEGEAEDSRISSNSVSELFYNRVSGGRIKTALVVTPFLLFTGGKKHYMTISFDKGEGQAGAVEFKLHKSNYRGVLRSVEQVTGVEHRLKRVRAVKSTIPRIAPTSSFNRGGCS